MTTSPARTLVVGLGCRTGCPADHLGALLLGVLQAHCLRADDILALASLDQRANEPGLLELARQLNRPLTVLSADELAPLADRLSHRSARVFAETGCHGVAESAALALADRLAARPATLLVTRQQSRLATVAIAEAFPT